MLSKLEASSAKMGLVSVQHLYSEGNAGDHFSRVPACWAILKGHQGPPIFLGDTSPFFPGILLFRKPADTKGKQLVFEKNHG